MTKSNIYVVRCCLLGSMLAIGAFGSPARAQEKGGDLRAAVQNPISSLYSLPFKFSFDYGAKNGEASFLNVQPVIPVTVGDWNLVNRVIVPLIDTPDQVKGLSSNNRPTLCLPSRSGPGVSREMSSEQRTRR